MHITALTAPEQRILGCLIEKKFTTPDQYPLSLNSLRLAANQSTNRDPVVSYDDHIVNEAAQRLARYGVVRLASGHSSRAVKYRHLAEETLGIQQSELALLCVLLLRGPQTSGELKARTERMVSFTSLDHVDAVLHSLTQKSYVARLERRPGQKEERWTQLLGGPVTAEAAAPPAALAVAAPAAPSVEQIPQISSTATSDLETRVARLEADVAELRAQLGA